LKTVALAFAGRRRGFEEKKELERRKLVKVLVQSSMASLTLQRDTYTVVEIK